MDERIETPTWEVIGDPEPCDWCGRPGEIERCEWWQGETLVGRNPAMREVCSFWFHQPGDVIDAMHDAGVADYDTVMEPFERELCRAWAKKVLLGTRRPQEPADRSLMTSSFSVRPALPDDTP